MEEPQYSGSIELTGDLEVVADDLTRQVFDKVPENELIIGVQVELKPAENAQVELTVIVITDDGTVP